MRRRLLLSAAAGCLLAAPARAKPGMLAHFARPLPFLQLLPHWQAAIMVA